jgi:hypothetical protein
MTFINRFDESCGTFGETKTNVVNGTMSTCPKNKKIKKIKNKK